jgi:hypothetical protein
VASRREARYDARVSPGGHLLTTLAACAASTAAGGPAALTAGIVLGGFLIDVDHALDYVLVERQRDLRPAAFLRYYVVTRPRRIVLILHSYEMFTLLGLLAWWVNVLPLWGYLMGGLMHLGLDIIFNGQQTPRSIGAFYCFTYRLAHRFDTVALIGERRTPAPAGFWRGFFEEFWPAAGAEATSAEASSQRAPST